MKRPAFQFYPADWRKDNELQACSIGARGLWHELLCVMHECRPYGYLTVNGKGATQVQAANLVGVPLGEFRKLLAELEAAGVPSRTDDGTIYSRRMVKDEHSRAARAAGGKLGADHGVKGGDFGKLGGRPRKQSTTPDSEPGSIPASTAQTDNATPVEKPPSNPPPSSSSSSSKDVGGKGTLVPPTEDKTVGENIPRKTTPPHGWWNTPHGIEAAGKMLGVSVAPGKDHEELKRRIFDFLGKRDKAA